MELTDHFFRHESGRIVATLTKILGLHNLDLAEDVTQDAFRRALETWSMRGIPENPGAWLMATAKNRALDILRRERRTLSFSSEFGALLSSEWTVEPLLDQLTEAHLVQDDLLRLMFSCCHPRLPEEARVALILHFLCGLSVREIAETYLSTHAAIDKRLVRAKKALAASGTLFNISQQVEFNERLPSVRQGLYLLFSQGYHGASNRAPVQPLLCREAIRLVHLLAEHPLGDDTETWALCALMDLHAARLSTRISETGELTPLADQNRALWDKDLVSRGMQALLRASSGASITEYHLEAMIAALHAQASTFSKTDWPQIVRLYDALLALQPSPVVALNRAIAIGERSGPLAALEAIRQIAHPERLESYPFYWAAQGEFESRLGHTEKAKAHFATAIRLARSPAERIHLQRKRDQ